MPPLISEEEIDVMDSDDESDNEPISTKMLEDICDGNTSNPNVNTRKARYKIRDHIKLMKTEQKCMLLSTRNMGKGLHKVFKDFVNDIL